MTKEERSEILKARMKNVRTAIQHYRLIRDFIRKEKDCYCSGKVYTKRLSIDNPAI